MKHFSQGKEATRDFPVVMGGHMALQIVNRRTGKTYVLDGWHDEGSAPAHIVTLDDWHAGNDRADIVEVGSAR